MPQVNQRTLGAAGVAKVAAGLLTTGWHVAWPMEDGGSGYDLLAHRQGERGQEFRRIQVKSAMAPRLNRSGNRGPGYKFSAARGKDVKTGYGNDCDLIAFVALDKNLLWILHPKKSGRTANLQPKNSIPWEALSDI